MATIFRRSALVTEDEAVVLWNGKFGEIDTIGRDRRCFFQPAPTHKYDAISDLDHLTCRSDHPFYESLATIFGVPECDELIWVWIPIAEAVFADD